MSILQEYLIENALPEWAVRGYLGRERALADTAKQHKLQVVIWEATRRCNLRCVHCGTPTEDCEVAKEMSTSQVLQVFSKIDNAFGIQSLACISITGGEPTLRTDLLEIVNQLCSRGASQIVMHTNGHKVAEDRQLLKKLVAAGITGIGVNIDGMEENHNWIRQHNKSFDLSIQALRQAKEVNVDTMVSTVVTSRSIKDLESLRDLVSRLQPGRWRLIPLEPIGRAKRQDVLTPEMFARVVDFVLETLTERSELSVEFGCGQWFGKKLEGLVRPYIWHCIAGLNVLGILHDGMIGACNNIDRCYCQGNALQDGIGKLWQSGFQVFRQRSWCQTGECADCSEWALCRGGEMHLRDSKGDRLSPCFFRWLEKTYQCVV